MHQRLLTAACVLACLLVALRGVNSSIAFEDGTTHEGKNATVNGGVSIALGGSIRGAIKTVDGGIGIDNTEVTLGGQKEEARRASPRSAPMIAVVSCS